MYLGDGTVPKSVLDTWLESSTEVEFDWPETWEMEGAATVQAVLDFLADDEFSEVSWTEGRVRVRALADKSGDAWLTYRGDLAIAFRLLANYGGCGSLTIVGFDDGPDEGIRIEARADGSSACVALGDKDVVAIRESPEYQEVLEFA